MSAARVKKTFYDDAVDAELALWLGVEAKRRKLSKHQKLVLTFNGETRFLVYPSTPSDRRGALNHVGDLKKLLLEMGAKRSPPPKAATAAKRRAAPKPRAPVSLTRDEPLRKDPTRDPWAQLSEMNFDAPAPVARSWWRKLAGRLFRRFA